MAGNDIVLAVEQALVVNHLVKDRRSHGIHAHRCRRARASAHGLGHSVGNKANGLLVALTRTIDNRRHAVTILNSVDLFVDTVAAVVKPCLKARHIVRFNTCEHVLYGRDHRDLIGPLSLAAGGAVGRVLVLGRLLIRSSVPAHHGRQVIILFGNRERVARKRVLLDLFDVAVYAVGQRQDRCDADNANRARKGRHGRAALLGHEVSGRKLQRRHKAHRGFARGFCLAMCDRGHIKGVGIVGDLAVRQADDARGVLVRQLGIVRDHDDQTIARNVLEQIHNLHGCR